MCTSASRCDSTFGGLCGQLPPPLLCLKGWEKGVVFINGQNLGRYWNIGPQETLYLPGAWLDQGLNQVGALFLGPLLIPALPVSRCFSGGSWRAGEDRSSDGPDLAPRQTGRVPQVIVFEEKMAGPVIQFTETPYLGRHLPELSSPQASWQGNSRPFCPRLQSRPSPAQPEKRVGGEGGPLPEELPGSVAAAVRLRCSHGRDGGSGWDCPPWG